MQAELPIRRDRNPGELSRDFLDAGCDRGSNDVLDALAKDAILMDYTVCMEVRDLDGGGKEQECGEQGNQQKTPRRVL
jgi:hypothetical protein